jgi:hypothetical protein
LCWEGDEVNRDGELDKLEKNETATGMAIYTTTPATMSYVDREDDELDDN